MVKLVNQYFIQLKGFVSLHFQVIDFFKSQISYQYPLDNSEMDPLEVIREAHEVILLLEIELQNI